MKVTATKLEDCFIIEPKIYKDNRGYFMESFNQHNFNKAIGKDLDFVQDNESMSGKGVLRGIHYQVGEQAQSKLVRVVTGKVLDVVVDLRKDSSTFGEHFSVELSAANKKQVFIPKGFGHGFLTLEDETIFSYKCDNFYNKNSESGIIFNDKDLDIDWILPHTELILSEKDLILPELKNIKPE